MTLGKRTLNYGNRHVWVTRGGPACLEQELGCQAVLFQGWGWHQLIQLHVGVAKGASLYRSMEWPGGVQSKNTGELMKDDQRRMRKTGKIWLQRSI